ncbi:Disease resistance protein RGA2 [Rhynchospora pubera]|uniref:Disease resistance protein RGA2 n=1 Tax=Rhynchospora pubera TaxID=906938 RepID=A0AAV8BQP5_9POAL|nr:Disease resistance protein RGA2 [Rhynchospora pubera]
MLLAIGKAFNLVPQSSRDSLKEDIDKLDRKLRRIQATVEEVENREIHDETVNLWLQELKCLVADAQDILDEYHYEILRCQLEVKPPETAILSGQGTNNHVSSNFSESISLEMTEKIRQINSRFDEISRDREALRLTNDEGKRRVDNFSINFSFTSHFMETDDIFGRSRDKEKIIDLLLFGGIDKLIVIPILGMGGIGKTTLAQMVYHDCSVQSLFDVMVWVYVSPEFDIIRVTKEIFEFVTGKTEYNSYFGLSKIQEVLQEKLAGKKVFLVLDDVWNVQQNDWKKLFHPFRDAILVRVLVTSRNDAVVQAPYTIFPHKLDVLPEDECLKLLYHCAYGGKRTRKMEWSVDIGKQIIKKCGGLPLAVKCIGRVLHYKKDKYRWREICYSELWESDDLDTIFSALKVSYYNLPPKLRNCFLFCSLFPKGSQLRKISVIYMWIAHGFIHPKGKKRAEDFGEEYLAELQMLSFIVPCTKGSFRLHDVIHDLARSLSGDEFHTIMDEKSSHIPDKIRHLYIKRGNNRCQSFRPQQLRTLLNATEITHDIRSVRLLGLISCNVLSLGPSLKHLRYLTIMDFNGESLPESLCCLYHLQTLEITRCYRLKELPTNIANLVNLRYLHITHVTIEGLPVMLWRLNNLQTLRIKGCCNLRVLPLGISNLLNLHVLQLKSCKRLEELPADTGNLINLSELDLSFSGMKTFPASMGLLKSTKIVLVGIPFDTIPGGIRKQLNSNLVLRRDKIITRLPCDYHQTVIVESPEYPNKWGQKLVHFGSELWQKIRNNTSATIVEDIDGVSQITWMSSQTQSSVAGIMSSE